MPAKPRRNRSPKPSSVEAFVHRVKITFPMMLLCSVLIVFFLIYAPLDEAVTTSLVDNFVQIANIHWQSLQNAIERNLEGARSLSSRTMIRMAIEKYEEGLLSLAELEEYHQGKYEDGAQALEHLSSAQRIVNGQVVASYSAVDASTSPLAIEPPHHPGDIMHAKLYVTSNQVYLGVVSPIVSGHTVLGHDIVVFDLTRTISLLCPEHTQETQILDDGQLQALLTDACMDSERTDRVVFSKGGFQYAALPMDTNFHFVSRQSQSTLFAQRNQLGMRILIQGAGTLLLFSLAVYFYVVRLAKRELTTLETTQTILTKAAQEANIDPLTKISNRRFGTQLLARSFAEFESTGISPAILMFDVDRFKQINDTYGHDVGDEVLIGVADHISRMIRAGDHLIRWGGDEFVGIFPGVREETAIHFGQKLAREVATLKIPAAETDISVTVSMGSSYFHPDDTCFNQALQRADQAMYRAKEQGRRNRSIPH
mgnify:CR=1 FL=1